MNSHRMNVEKLFLFPTLVCVSDNCLSLDECINVKEYLLKKVPTKEHSALNYEGSKSSFYNDDDKEKSVIYQLENNNIVNDLSKRIELVAAEYLKDYSVACFGNLKITNSWYNFNNKNSTLNFHTHPGSLLVGALYVECDEESSCLELINSNPVSNFVFNDVNNRAAIKPEKGRLVMFPGWIEHGFSEKNCSDERIVISFNIG